MLGKQVEEVICLVQVASVTASFDIPDGSPIYMAFQKHKLHYGMPTHEKQSSLTILQTPEGPEGNPGVPCVNLLFFLFVCPNIGFMPPSHCS